MPNDFERWQTGLMAAAKKAVEETAVAIRDDAKENAPVDTGALRASIHVKTQDRSDYDLAVAEAKALGGTKRFGPQYDSDTWGPRLAPDEPLNGVIWGPRITAEQPLVGSEFSVHARVGSPLNYATFVEHGFFHVRANRYIAGRPFLQTAEDKNRGLLERVFEKEMARIQ